MVQIHFESQSSSDAVVEGVDRAFRRLGWNPDYVNNQPTFIQVGLGEPFGLRFCCEGSAIGWGSRPEHSNTGPGLVRYSTASRPSGFRLLTSHFHADFTEEPSPIGERQPRAEENKCACEDTAHPDQFRRPGK